MHEAIKSALSLAWATSLFGAAQGARVLQSSLDDGATAACSFDRVAQTAARELPRTSHDDGRSGPAMEGPMTQQVRGATRRGLDVDRVVVLGEGISAGAGGFALSEESQWASFAVQ